MKYYVTRFYNQLSAANQVEQKTATYLLEDQIAAMKQYYKFLAADIDDANKFHILCMVIDSNGKVLARQTFDHPIPVKEEEPEEEIEEEFVEDTQ